jgi:Helix-turn-helix domain
MSGEDESFVGASYDMKAVEAKARGEVLFPFEERGADSPLVERIWRTRCERPGEFTSLAASHRELVVMQHNGRLTLTLRAPEARASPVFCSIEAEWFGIILKLGAFLPNLPDDQLVNGGIDLPEASSGRFWLQGSAWEYPTFENADVFVARLVREGLLVRDPVVDAALRNEPQEVSSRWVQHRFVRATGLPQRAVRQIERARYATILLQDGLPILETAVRAGYADQAHLTRSLKRFIGQTPAQLARPDNPVSTSFLFKTAQPPDVTIRDEPAVNPGRHRENGQGAGQHG